MVSFIKFFLVQPCLSKRAEHLPCWQTSHSQTIHLEKSLSVESKMSTFYENVFNGVRSLSCQTLWFLFLFEDKRMCKPCMTNTQLGYNDLCCIFIFTNPSTQAGYDTRSIFKQCLTCLNSEFSKAEEPHLPYYLPIAGGRIIGFIPYPRVLVLRKMQSVSSRIWTCVTESISSDDNHYTTSTSSLCCILTIDRAVNQRCTCVNKRKKKRKQVGVRKEYWQVPAAVELVGDRKARVRTSLQTESCGPQWPPVEQPQPRCGRSAVMVKKRSWVNIAVCPCLHSSLTQHRNINPFENKVWEIHIFIKKRVRSFIEVVNHLWLCFCICLYMYTLSIQHLFSSWFSESWSPFFQSGLGLEVFILDVIPALWPFCMKEFVDFGSLVNIRNLKFVGGQTQCPTWLPSLLFHFLSLQCGFGSSI